MVKARFTDAVFRLFILAAVVVYAVPDLVMAQDAGLGGLVKSVAQEQLPVLPFILSAVAYVGGAFMIVSGALKLKAHAEKPDQNPMAPGISRLLAGGAITAVPALVKILQDTTKLKATDKAAFGNFDVKFN